MKFYFYPILFFLLTANFATAQLNGSLHLSFRLVDSSGHFFNHYQFETSIEMYAGISQMNALVHQKRLHFDDRSYYFNYETDKPGKIAERIYFIKGKDTLIVELPKTKANYIIIDALELSNGLVILTEKNGKSMTGNTSPGRSSVVLLFEAVERELEPEGLSIPKNMTRVRFSNYMEVLNSKR